MWKAPTSGGDVQTTFLFIIFLLNVLLAAKLLYHIVLGKRSRHVWVERLVAVVASFVVFWQAFDWICFTQIQGEVSPFFADPLWGVGAICLAAIASWTYLRFAATEFSWKNLAGIHCVWMLAIVSFTATAWSGYRFYGTTVPVPFAMDYLVPPGMRAATDEFVGVTDQGRTIHLSKWEVDPKEFDAFDFDAMYASVQAITAVIPRASPDASSNCHGWVFTGGLFHISGQEVNQILADNGYEKVDSPRADDLIIYRDSKDQVVHTGLVRGVLEDGTVMVESKWSVSGRFLHMPEDQPYSESFTYYRSPRLWHLLTIVPAANLAPMEGVPAEGADSWIPGPQTAHGEVSPPVSDEDRVTL